MPYRYLDLLHVVDRVLLQNRAVPRPHIGFVGLTWFHSAETGAL
jgi:hypothetical protein